MMITDRAGQPVVTRPPVDCDIVQVPAIAKRSSDLRCGNDPSLVSGHHHDRQAAGAEHLASTANVPDRHRNTTPWA